MANENLKNNVDSLVVFVFLKRLLEPIVQTDAYKLGLVDSNGKVLKVPESKEEIEALTILDRLVFKLRRMLGTKIPILNKFLFVLTSKNDYLNNLSFNNTVQGKAELIRIKDELNRLGEKYNRSLESMLIEMIHDDIKRIDETPHVELMNDLFVDFRREDDKKWILKVVEYYKRNRNKIPEMNKHLLSDMFFRIAFKKDLHNLTPVEQIMTHRYLPKEFFN